LPINVAKVEYSESGGKAQLSIAGEGAGVGDAVYYRNFPGHIFLPERRWPEFPQML